jgi:hypothetical protein
MVSLASLAVNQFHLYTPKYSPTHGFYLNVAVVVGYWIEVDALRTAKWIGFGITAG